MSENYFNILNSVNVNDKIEKKNGLNYLSWSFSWAEVKKRFPDATYTIYENQDGWCYHTDGRTCWVKTGVTVNGIEHIEFLPVMDYKNRSIPVDAVTSFDVNKTIQRSLTKAVARHGLGLYVYAGEDLPDDENAAPRTPSAEELKAQAKEQPVLCSHCGREIKPYLNDDGKMVSVKKHVEGSRERFAGKVWCLDCIRKYLGGETNA